MATKDDVLAELRDAIKDPAISRERFQDLEARIKSVQELDQ